MRFHCNLNTFYHQQEITTYHSEMVTNCLKIAYHHPEMDAHHSEMVADHSEMDADHLEMLADHLEMVADSLELVHHYVFAIFRQ